MEEIKSIPGVWKLSNFLHSDSRGKLAKLRTKMDNFGLIGTTEIFFTVSNKNTFRGMHLQWGTHSTNKIITLVSGAIDWYLIDCRDGVNKGLIYTETIREPFANSYAIPIGVAQGYLVREDNTKVLYQMDGDFCKLCDTGLKSNEILELAKTSSQNSLILSARDQELANICFPKFHE